MENKKTSKEYIESLKINRDNIITKIADELSLKLNNVKNTIKLLEEDNTIPFISRYRKEMTGSMDETNVRETSNRYKYLNHIEERKIEIIKAIYSQDKLTDDLLKNIQKGETLSEIEDIYAPYKKKKKTRGMIAKEKGLEKLAEFMLKHSDDEIKNEAKKYLSDKLKVKTIEEAIQGAEDILAENISEQLENKRNIKKFIIATGEIIVNGLKDKEKSTYQMYYDYKEPIKNIKPHRILAINRGGHESELISSFSFDKEQVDDLLIKKIDPCNNYYKDTVKDSIKRLILPSVKREIKSNLKETSEKYAIGIFEKNLDKLLMQQPIKETRILGIDPGIRTGSKAAMVNETGKFLNHFVFNQEDKETSIKKIMDSIKNNKVELIAIGNGTGTETIQQIVSDIIKDTDLEVEYTVVSEDGASVYSASSIAKEEFPDIDLTIRGAISIARRIQDPLAELVKIDPKSIGVGLYQHDVDQKQLTLKLDEVIESVVNRIGVNINTASWALLSYVSGITKSIAKKMIQYRDDNGKYRSRDKFTNVDGLGDKAYEQSAGFLRIPDSEEKLDNTWVHPENYALGKEILKIINEENKIDDQIKNRLINKYNTGKETISDIILALEKPNLDPRDDYPKPMRLKDIIKFEDMNIGMVLTGKVKNVVNFGAFIDLNIKESGLLHISQMSDKYIKDPFEVVHVGDTVKVKIIEIDPVRKRISLTMKDIS